jgi:hypothetical protein
MAAITITLSDKLATSIDAALCGEVEARAVLCCVQDLVVEARRRATSGTYDDYNLDDDPAFACACGNPSAFGLIHTTGSGGCRPFAAGGSHI